MTNLWRLHHPHIIQKMVMHFVVSPFQVGFKTGASVGGSLWAWPGKIVKDGLLLDCLSRK